MLKCVALFAIIATGLGVSVTVEAQKSSQTIEPIEPEEEYPVTRAPVDPVDPFGQRQTREGVAKNAGIEPLGRINTRVQNRVELRLRNRIDRNYHPQANAMSPFVIAGDQARAAGRHSR